jgi:gliding motility-associated-like protein
LINHVVLSIYDRWGQRIHQSQGENPTWDGKIADVDCPEGIYAYSFDFDYNYASDKEQKSGSLLLIRKY